MDWDNFDDPSRAKSAGEMDAYTGIVDRMGCQVLNYLKLIREIDSAYIIFMVSIL